MPTTDDNRIVELDALRGFLLFFIFFANLPVFAGYWFMSPEQQAALISPIDRQLLFLSDVLVTGKFYTLFSLLFGIGFAVILSRIAAKGMDGVSVYRRRLAALAVIGLIHLLTWPGDILLAYALCGFLLLLFRNARDRTLLKAATFMILLPIPYYGLAWLTGGYSDLATYMLEFIRGTLAPAMGVDQNPMPALQSGSLIDVIRIHVVGSFHRWMRMFIEGRLFKILGVFLIGLWIGRRILSGALLGNTRLLKRVLVIGLLIGIPANIGLAYLLDMHVAWPRSWLGLLQYTLYAVGVVPLALAYAAGFLLLWQNETVRHALRVFVPMGRMALTNYLMQSVIGIGFFYGIGFGQMGLHSPSDWLLIALVVIAFQAAFSAAWMRYHRFGPLEWVWRGATYGFSNLRKTTPVAQQT